MFGSYDHHQAKNILLARIRWWGFLFMSTQRHYRRLILLLILLYCYMFRSYDHHQAENILLARIRWWGFLHLSMQRHYRRLILLLILLHCYMFWSYNHHQAENILRVTQLTTDPLFYNTANIIVIGKRLDLHLKLSSSDPDIRRVLNS
jgi:hypothetical protein